MRAQRTARRWARRAEREGRQGDRVREAAGRQSRDLFVGHASTPCQDITAGGGRSVAPGAVPDISTRGCRGATLAPFTVVSTPIKSIG
jgi:hypothetical protein